MAKKNCYIKMIRTVIQTYEPKPLGLIKDFLNDQL